MSIAWIAVILFMILDLLLLYWIGTVKTNITNIQSNESVISPLYFCDFYTDPTTNQQEPGSLCYVNDSDSINQMVAYRYTDSGYECQKTRISNNIVMSGYDWLTPQELLT